MKKVKQIKINKSDEIFDNIKTFSKISFMMKSVKIYAEKSRVNLKQIKNKHIRRNVR